MICQHAINGNCQISSELAGIEVPLDEQACTACNQQDHPRELNEVTCFRARYILRQNNLPIPNKVQECVNLHQKKVYLTEGPGRELRKLIEWFPLRKKKCRSCKGLEVKMNQWGPDKCEEKKDYIVKKLLIAAARRKIPTNERLVTIVVSKAIRQARKNQ